MSDLDSQSDKEEQKSKDVLPKDQKYLPKISKELDEDIPPEIQRDIKTFMAMGRFSSSPMSSVLEKINEKHIDKLIESAAKDDERSFIDSQSARRYNFWIFVIVLVFFSGLTFFLVNKDVQLYQDILKIIVIFGGGFGSGFGFKGYLDKKNK